MIVSRIDSRAWLIWGIALSLIPVLGRNPFPLTATLLVAIAVRTGTAQPGDLGWNRLVRLTLLFGTIGVVFNVITYHGGDRSIAELPAWIPVFGGPITLNALLFGLLSGLALITLVIIWSTVAARVDWSDLIRLTPPALSNIAVSSSIALTLAPKIVEAFREIREVQMIRGFAMRGPRDFAPMVAPLLTLGLERSVTLSEALESRGFGGPESSPASGYRRLALIGAGLTSLALAVFLVATERELAGLAFVLLAVITAWLAIRVRATETTWRPTRYRSITLDTRDWSIIAVSTLSAVCLLGINRLDRGAVFYEPYPTIASPTVNVVLLLVISLLLIPLVHPHRKDDATW